MFAPFDTAVAPGPGSCCLRFRVRARSRARMSPLLPPPCVGRNVTPLSPAGLPGRSIAWREERFVKATLIIGREMEGEERVSC